MSKHTPGPWAVDDDGIVYRKAVARHDYIKFASAWVEGAWVGSDGDEESRANARLIAAAPDLLEALRKVCIALENIGGEHVTGLDGSDEALSAAWAAIAKATGGAA